MFLKFRPEPFSIRSKWNIDAPVTEVRAVFENPLSILDWWSSVFLAGEAIEPVGATSGAFQAKFYTKGFLPHTFQFLATISSLEEDRLVISTSGDFDGVGTIVLLEKGEQTLVTVEWQVIVNQPYILPFLFILKPVFVWNHIWAMRQGRLGFEAALARNKLNGSIVKYPASTFPHNFSFLRNPRRWRV